MHCSVQATLRIKQLFEHGIYIYSFAYVVKSMLLSLFSFVIIIIIIFLYIFRYDPGLNGSFFADILSKLTQSQLHLLYNCSTSYFNLSQCSNYLEQ